MTRVTDFGLFVELGDEIPGLIHIGELSDTVIEHPSEIANVDDIVTAVVLRVDTDERKIGLSIKRLSQNGPPQ